jgi:hypothetical protein
MSKSPYLYAEKVIYFKMTLNIVDITRVCYIYNILSDSEMDFYSASSLKQQSADRHVTPIGHINLIPSHLVFVLQCLSHLIFMQKK